MCTYQLSRNDRLNAVRKNNTPLDLTIVIPTRNEEKNLPKCLEAIGNDFARKIVVLDSASTDDTLAIANSYGVGTLQFVWNGRFPKKRNWFLREHTPETTWVLFLDADEILTEAFKNELQRVLPSTRHNGFWIKYTIYFLGKQLRYGYPMEKLSLFRIGTGEYERIDEQQWSQLDMEIHEHPILDGTVGTIRAKIDHRDMRCISQYVVKHNEYSTWEAKRYLATLNVANTGAMFTFKQQIKYRVIKSPVAGIIYFLGAYFLMGGFMDGKRGLAFAMLKASYFTQIYCKICEMSHLDENSTARIELFSRGDWDREVLRGNG